MSEYAKLATEAGDQYLSALAEGQEKFLEALATLTASAPPVPPFAAPAFAAPAFAATFPTPQEVSEASFSFAGKLLKQQQAFTEKLLAASVPAKSTASEKRASGKR